MKYSEQTIEEVRQQNDIVSLIGEYTTLTKRGQSYIGLCPFHHEKTPSFNVSESNQLYYCFGCGAGGNVITFLMNKENMSFTEALRYLADRANIKLEDTYLTEEEIEKNKKRVKLLEIMKETARQFHYNLMAEENRFALDYLLKRGLTLGTIRKFGLGYATNDFQQLYQVLRKKGYSDELLLASGLFIRGKKDTTKLYDRFNNRMMYPIFDISKAVIAFGGRVLDNSLPKYLNSPENMLFNKSHHLYGMQLAKGANAPYFILVEGYMDVIAMHQAGFTQAVASLGTSLTKDQAKLLKRYTNEVIILYDSDAAGKKAALRAIPILKNVGINMRVLSLQEGKDPDEYLKTHGYDGMKVLLKQANSDIWFQVRMIEQKYQLDRSEEKIRFLQEVAILLGKLESSVEQMIYLKEISQHYEMNEEVLKAEMNRSQNKTILMKKPVPIVEKVKKKQKFGMVADFLADLYHYPNLKDDIKEYLKNYIKPECFEDKLLQELAREVLNFVTLNEEVNEAYFTTHYTDAKDQNIIAHVLMNKDDRYEDVAILEKDIIDNIKVISEDYLNKQFKLVNNANEMTEITKQRKMLKDDYMKLQEAQ